jgi:hypothetical protein
VALAALADPPPGPTSCIERKISASDGAFLDFFGSSVSVSGTLAIVGARMADTPDEPFPDNAGAAWVYRRDLDGPQNWGEVTRLAPETVSSGAEFGISVSISGQLAVVGAPEWFDSKALLRTGAAFVFSRNEGGSDNWGQVARLTASDAADDARFGRSVSICGDLIIVGANADEFAGTNEAIGSAYVFARNQGGLDNWGEVATLTADDGEAGDDFGFSVAICGDIAVVGAADDDDMGMDAGAAYVFQQHLGGANNWGQLTKVTATDGSDFAGLGESVSISGQRFVAGARGAAVKGSVPGAAYVHARNEGGENNWGEVAKLTPSDGEFGNEFGVVSIDGDMVVVGAWGDDENGFNSGSAYVFDRDEGGDDNWGEVQKINASDGFNGHNFGQAVGVSGNVVIAGAINADGIVNDSGAAYVFFSCPGSPVDVNGDGLINADDLVEIILNWGPCPPEEPCPADTNDDGVVDVEDLLNLILSWPT